MAFRLWFAGAILCAVLGCGGSGARDQSSGPTPQQTADSVAEMLKEYNATAKKAPTGVGDLADATAAHPLGHAAVMSREYLVVWRAPISASGGGAVLAYHKDAPTAGGYVVMQDGTVKQMSAEEFKSAPKAK